MSGRTPIVLLVVAAMLFAYVMLFERGGPSRKEIDSRSGLLLEAVVRERITGVRIASGDERVALVRTGEGFDEDWTLQEPKEAPADPDLIEDYLRNWEFAIPVRTLQSPSPEDLQNFGMETPKAEVSFEMGRSKVRISLGSGAPVDGGGYVRIDDRQRDLGRRQRRRRAVRAQCSRVRAQGRCGRAGSFRPPGRGARCRSCRARCWRGCALTTSPRPWRASRAMRIPKARCSC